jgi:predicted nucleic acid-binding protein
VRLVVLDPQFLAAAFLSPKRRCRKLLVVLAYGRLVSNVERVNAAEMDKLKEEGKAAADGPTTIGGPIDELHQRENELRALLAERLPVVTPTEFGLATSPEVLDRVQALMQAARENRPSLPTDAADLVRRRLCSHTAKVHMHLDQWTIPRYTDGRAPGQEWLIHLATQAGAEFLITGDERIAPDPAGPTPYVHEQTQKQTQAWRLDSFIDAELEGYHFSLDDVDGELPDIEP